MAIKPIEILINAKDNASGVFDSLKAKVATVGAAIAAYFGISAFVGVVKGAADLEAAMSRVQAATGATADELAALRKAAEDAGANTKYTSTEAAAALENLAKAGLSSKEAIAALPAVLNLAQAGDIELATASEFVTKAVMGMGLAFEDAGRVADVLAMGANATNTSVTGLAQALSYAAPVAQSLGLSLESTVAIIGKFADAGIDASRAGTALNSILSQFSNPASAFRNELAAAGITTGNFEQALQQLAAAGPKGSKAILAVGQEAGPALRALLNQGMGALSELTEKLKGAEGSAAATAKVMQDNLNGALSGLSSAWDTVKNALGTPVLPVLKDGVDQLAAAFRAAVADGTVQKFGTAIATAFQNGLKFVREFVAGIDFDAVLARMQKFADDTNATLTKVGEYATNAGNVFKTAWGVMTAGSNTVLVVIYGLGEAFAKVAQGIMTGVAKLREGLASVTFGSLSAAFKEAARDAEISAGAFGAVADAMGQKGSAALAAVADGARLARDGFAGLTSAVSAAAPQVKTTSVALSDVAKQLEVAAEKNAKARAATEAKAASDAAAAAEIQRLKDSYRAFIEAGDLQRAAEAFAKLEAAQRASAAAGKDAVKAAQDAAAQVSAAFERLGVVSTAVLKDQAASAQRDYKTIKDSGTATAQDLANAFEVAANKAIAANKGIAPSWVQAEAAVRGLRLETDAAGTTIVRKMNDAAGATANVGQAASGAAKHYGNLATQATRAGDAIQRYNKYAAPGDPGNQAIDDKERAARLAGQGAAVDTSAMFEAVRKLESNSLTSEDIPLIRSVLEAIRSGQAGQSALVGLSSLDGITDTQKWNNYGARLRQQLALLDGATSTEVGSSTPVSTKQAVASEQTVVNISLEGRKYTIPTSSSGRTDLEALIRALADGKGTST